MNISRRWFIGGAASFGAFGGCRLFESHDYRAGGRPNLTFGVVSDIHVSRMAGNPAQEIAENVATFRHALEYFRDAGADAVVIAGDIADSGAIAQLELVMSVWREVFPDDRAPDGRPVEKLFVYGNHDMGGLPYGRARFKGLSDAEINKHIIYPDPKSVWERVVGEPYAPIWKKEVKGYSFVGAQWLAKGCRGKNEAFNAGLADFYGKNRAAFDPKKPFFHIQHPHPLNTCYGPWAWGRDAGLSTKALAAFPNAVAFSGHSHYSLTDERSVWQGAFTSVGTSSLRYLAVTYNEEPEGFENGVREWSPDSWRFEAAKLTRRMCAAGQQGMVWRVYDDCMVAERRDFQLNLPLGDDWVIPLETAEPRPFAFAERAKKFAAPAFADGAKLEIAKVRAKNRGGKTAKEEIPSVEQDALRLTIPPVRPDPRARAHVFEVVAVSGGVRRRKVFEARGAGSPPAYGDAKQPTECLFAAKDFPKGVPIAFTVTPENFFRTRGAPLAATFSNT